MSTAVMGEGFQRYATARCLASIQAARVANVLGESEVWNSIYENFKAGN